MGSAHSEAEPCGLYISGVDQSWNNKRVYKFLQDNGIRCQSVKKEPGQKFVSVYFDSDFDRQDAIYRLSMKRIGNRCLTMVPLKKSLVEAEMAAIAAKYPNKRVKSVAEIVLPWIRIDYAEQIRQKSLKYRRILDPICGRVWPVLDVVGAHKYTNYMSQVQLVITLDENHEISIGFSIGSHSVGGIDGCVHVPSVTESIVTRLTDIIKRSHDPVFDEDSRVGCWKFVRICCNHDESEVMLVIGTYGKLHESTLELLRQGFSDVTSLYWTEAYVTEAITGNSISHLISGEDHITTKILETMFPVYPDTVIPTNLEMAENLISELVKREQIDKNTVVLELDPNDGIYTLALAKFAERVIAVDRNAGNTRRIQMTAEANSINNVQIVHSNMDQLHGMLSENSSRVVMIVHPPDFGCRRELYAELREATFIDNLAIFSNNPEVLVRELELFLLADEPAFRIESCLGFDTAPHTDKMQLLVTMSR